MSELSPDVARPVDPIGRVLFSISYVFALAGGVLMAALTIMTVASVFGRWLFSAPIYGDFEMVAMGTAVSVFLFLPYCHMKKGNVVVDLFLNWAPRRVQGFFDGIGALLLGGIAVMVTWRLYLGGQDMFQYSETSMILGIPTWWAFPFGVAAMALLSLCCLYTAIADLIRTFR